MSRLSIIEDQAVTLTAATRLTEEVFDQALFLASAGGFAVTLPPVRAGLRFNVFVKVAPTTAYVISSAGSSNIIVGSNVSADLNAGTDADFEAAGCDTVTLVANKAVIGDSLEFFSDGVRWYVRAFTSVFDAVTFTTAS